MAKKLTNSRSLRSSLIRTLWVAIAVVVNVASPAHADGQTGVRISLPICKRSSVPSNFDLHQYTFMANEWRKGTSCDASNCGILWEEFPINSPRTLITTLPEIQPNMRHLDTVDWGDDNALFGVDHISCGPGDPAGYAALWPQFVNNSVSGGVLAHVHGYFTNTSDSYVYGEVAFNQYGRNDPLILALQVLQESGWVDIRTSTVSAVCDQRTTTKSCNVIAGISATVPANSDVRLELRTISQNFGYGPWQYVELTWATLFGAECFPDASNPDMCLQQ